MVGEDYARVCLPGGDWSGSSPECVSKDCDVDDDDDIGNFCTVLSISKSLHYIRLLRTWKY